DYKGVRKRRKKTSAIYTPTHTGTQLGDLREPPHYRVVKEYSAAAVLTGKHARLVWEINTGRVDQIDYRRATPHCDFLRKKNLSDRLGPPRSCLNRRIVGHHGYAASLSSPDDRHDPGCGGLAVVLVVRNQQSRLLHVRAGVEQQRDPFPRCKFPLLVLALDLFRSSALSDAVFDYSEFVE